MFLQRFFSPDEAAGAAVPDPKAEAKATEPVKTLTFKGDGQDMAFDLTKKEDVDKLVDLASFGAGAKRWKTERDTEAERAKKLEADLTEFRTKHDEEMGAVQAYLEDLAKEEPPEEGTPERAIYEARKAQREVEALRNERLTEVKKTEAQRKAEAEADRIIASTWAAAGYNPETKAFENFPNAEEEDVRTAARLLFAGTIKDPKAYLSKMDELRRDSKEAKEERQRKAALASKAAAGAGTGAEGVTQAIRTGPAFEPGMSTQQILERARQHEKSVLERAAEG